MTSCTLTLMTVMAVPGAFVIGAAIYHAFLKLFSVAVQIKWDIGYIFVPLTSAIAIVFVMQVTLPKHITVTQCHSTVTQPSKYNACLINRLIHRG
jgi:hypothetical protein